MGVNQSVSRAAMAGPVLEDRNLQVVLEIERGGPCGLDCLDGDIVDIDVRFDEERCNVDATVRDPADERVSTHHFKNDLCEHCPGEIFADHGCLPRYTEIVTGAFVVMTYVEDTETVASLVGEIREVSERVSVRSIVSTETSDFQEDSSIDLSALTRKQREAVYHAQQMGYYDSDSDVTLDQLADRVGISPSALSQRLQRAEANVLKQIPCDCASIVDPDCDC